MSAIKTDEIKNENNGTPYKAKDHATTTHETLKSSDTANDTGATGASVSSPHEAVEEEKILDKAGSCCGNNEHACGCKDIGEAQPHACNNEKSSLEAENRRLTDEMLRMRAEMENSKKRLHRLFEEKAQEKSKQLLLDIITLLDNFERAMSADESSKQGQNAASSANAVVDGIKMMEEEFLQTLSNKWGLTRYKSINLAFDPSLHEAMMKEYSDEVSCETVTEEFMKGYMFYEKVLRPAKVKVAVPKAQE